jgi:hypothetical protein
VANFDLYPAGEHAFIMSGGWAGPAQPHEELRGLINPERCARWGWNSVQGYVGISPRWIRMAVYDQNKAGLYYLLQEGMMDNKMAAKWTECWVRWTGRLGGRWIVSPIPLPSQNLKLIDHFSGKYFAIHLYQNLAWKGAAWITHQLVRLPDEEETVNHYLFNGGFFKDEAIVMGEPDAPQPAALPPGVPAEPLRVVSSRPERVEVECALAAPGYLVLNLAYHPRWKATMDDGRPLQPLRVNISQLAVALPAGRHRVIFSFEGRLEKISLLLSLAAMVAGGWLIFRKSSTRWSGF